MPTRRGESWSRSNSSAGATTSDLRPGSPGLPVCYCRYGAQHAISLLACGANTAELCTRLQPALMSWVCVCVCVCVCVALVSL